MIEIPGTVPQQVTRRRSGGRLRLRLRRRWSRLYLPLARALRSGRRQRSYLRGVDKGRRWRRSSPLTRALRSFSYVGGVVLVAWMVWAAVVVVSNDVHHGPIDIEAACNATSFSCSALAGTLGPVFSLALASAVFLLVRLRVVRRPYVRTARDHPGEVVPTAGKIIGEVVGRDELCNVIVADLRDPRTRRPHVVIGGVGTGKTALLVRLTQLLAERQAVPVAVRLRDAQDGLDFRELARRQFIADADRALTRPLSDDEGAKVWRHLLKDDQVVVLADGLEEALMEGSPNADRDNLIRLALRRASRDRLPLVVASRPHDPLRGMVAAILELEPLSEEAAFQYVQRGDPHDDVRRLDWVIETAEIAETPLYLQITRQLNEKDLLKYVSRSRDDRQLDTRGVDRAELRFRLLQAWEGALIRSDFLPEVPLSQQDRKAAIEHLSVLACIGLKQDRLEVKLQDVDELLKRTSGQRALPMIAAMERRLEELDRRPDMRLAASWGRDLGLVEMQGESVRFQHSIMQSYLGARVIDVAMADPVYRKHALEEPGRELLIALVLHSRDRGWRAGQRVASIRVRLPGPRRAERPLAALLLDAARCRDDVKALDLYAAALLADSVDETPAHSEIADQVEKHWRGVAARDPRTLEEAKLNLVHRYAEAVRIITERDAREPRLRALPAYRQMFRIACCEPLYSVRLAAAQEIGADGDEAFKALEGTLLPPDVDKRPGLRGRWNRRRPVDTSGPARPTDDREEEERRHRETVIRAWLAPLLVGSVDDSRDPARKHLEHWLEFVRTRDRRPGGPGAGLSPEVGLALGFKYAANRRLPGGQDEARAYLTERAREMLRASDFWFTRLILIQALCLWHLPRQPERQNREPGRKIDYGTLVRHWGGGQAIGSEHPFVAEARRLAVSALETGQPERFLWIDESGIVSRIGSRPADPAERRKHNLWIPPSEGWTALHPRAQQLVADVLLLLNLAERRGGPSERDRRLQRTNRNFLPPCLAGDRSPLDPTRTTGTAPRSDPGSNCAPGCPFELCPYPPKGAQHYRNELSEAFCRRQQALIGRHSLRAHTAPWQQAPPKDLRLFWEQIGRPAQQSEMGHDRGRRRRSRPDRGRA